MREHVRILGILNIIFGVLHLLVALIVILVFGGISSMLGYIGMTEEPGAGIAAGIVGLVGMLIVLAIAVSTVPAMLAGWGLLQGYGWARILAIILAIFDLFNPPLGTALGIYTLVILLDQRAVEYFRSGASLTPAPPTSEPLS